MIFPLPEFVSVESVEDIKKCGEKWEYPLMLKSRLNAYDGKGNAVIKTEKDIEKATEKLGGVKPNALYVERWCPFVKELAVMVARGKDGEIVAHPVVETVQTDNVCHVVVAPARVSSSVLKSASEIAQKAFLVLPGRGFSRSRTFRASRWYSSVERDCTSSSQFWSLHYRGLCDRSVRAASSCCVGTASWRCFHESRCLRL